MNQKLDDIDNHDLAAEVASRLARSAAGAGDWVDAFIGGEILTSDQAATILGASSDTARRRCVEANDIGKPLGICVGGIWLISLARLLRDVETRRGRHERAAAEERETPTAIRLRSSGIRPGST